MTFSFLCLIMKLVRNFFGVLISLSPPQERRELEQPLTLTQTQGPTINNMMNTNDQIIGIIGGTGLGDALEKRILDRKLVDVLTPFGKPADKILVGTFGRRRIAFLNRHGKGHLYPPSRVPYAANIFALKKLGVRTIISMGAVGSLNESIAPGDLVVVDQFIDKTFKRTNTFFNEYGAVHVELADPACGRLREKIVDTAQSSNINGGHKVHSSGTYVCMEGPSFSTRAESLMHKVSII